MSGLDDLNEDTPTGLNVPTQGANELRATKAKVKEYAAVEHAYNGRHKFQTVSILPSNDTNSRRIVIKTTVGMPDELYYDNGTTWVKITSNSEIAGNIADLLAHTLSNPIDHSDGSITSNKLSTACVTSTKIANGGVLGRHLNADDSINPDYSVASLVDGSGIDATWHTHPQYDLGGSSGVNFLSSVLSVASGSSDIGWTTINANTASGGVIPVTAKAVMLSINVSLVNSELGEALTGINISGRKTVGSPSIIMSQYRVPTAVTNNSLLSSQSICPMTGDNGMFDISVTNTAANVGTWDISIFGYYL